MASGRPLQPQPIPTDLSVADLVDQFFLAYNAARLSEACQLIAQKILRRKLRCTVAPRTTGDAEATRMKQAATSK